jgi:hypothetical protein
MTSIVNRLRTAALAVAVVAGAALPALAQSAPPAYNPAPGANLFPMAEGYSWTYKDRRGNLHDIRCVGYSATERLGTFHNLSGKGEITEVKRTVDRYRQPVLDARQIDRRRNFALWGKLFASRYPWTWTGTDDATLKGERRSAWYRSATEPAGTFLRPLVYDIAPAPGVADAGIRQIALEPGIGIIEQTFTTIAGPNSWELDSAKTAAGQVPAILYGVETRLTLTPSSYVYPGIIPAGTGGFRPPMVSATLEARVRRGSRIVHPLTFMSSQRIEVEVYDEDNRLVYRWSDGRPFNRIMIMTELKDGQPFRATVTDIPMPGPLMDHRHRYRVKAFIADREAQGGNERFAAQELMSVLAGV